MKLKLNRSLRAALVASYAVAIPLATTVSTGALVAGVVAYSLSAQAMATEYITEGGESGSGATYLFGTAGADDTVIIRLGYTSTDDDGVETTTSTKFWWSTVPDYVSDAGIIQIDSWVVTDGSSNKYWTFNSKITGTGDIEFNPWGDANNNGYTFTGDMSEWTGDLISTSYGELDVTITGTSSTAASGTGSISLAGSKDEEYLTYSFTGETTIANTSISTPNLSLAGGGTYTLSLTDAESPTLTVSGTTKIAADTSLLVASGTSASLLDLELGAGSSLSVADGASVTITGEIDLTSTSSLINNGTLDLSSASLLFSDFVAVDDYILGSGFDYSDLEVAFGSTDNAGYGYSWSTDGDGNIVLSVTAASSYIWAGVDGDWSDASWNNGTVDGQTITDSAYVTINGTTDGTDITLGAAASTIILTLTADEGESISLTGTGSITNESSLVKTGEGSASVDVAVTTGSVEAQAGTLTFNGDLTLTGGMNITGGDVVINSSVDIQGTTTANFGIGSGNAADYQVSAQVADGGSLTLNKASTITGTVYVDDGTLTLNDAGNTFTLANIYYDRRDLDYHTNNLVIGANTTVNVNGGANASATSAYNNYFMGNLNVELGANSVISDNVNLWSGHGTVDISGAEGVTNENAGTYQVSTFVTNYTGSYYGGGAVSVNIGEGAIFEVLGTGASAFFISGSLSTSISVSGTLIINTGIKFTLDSTININDGGTFQMNAGAYATANASTAVTLNVNTGASLIVGDRGSNAQGSLVVNMAGGTITTSTGTLDTDLSISASSAIASSTDATVLDSTISYSGGVISSLDLANAGTVSLGDNFVLEMSGVASGSYTVLTNATGLEATGLTLSLDGVALTVDDAQMDWTVSNGTYAVDYMLRESYYYVASSGKFHESNSSSDTVVTGDVTGQKLVMDALSNSTANTASILTGTAYSISFDLNGYDVDLGSSELKSSTSILIEGDGRLYIGNEISATDGITVDATELLFSSRTNGNITTQKENASITSDITLTNGAQINGGKAMYYIADSTSNGSITMGDNGVVKYNSVTDATLNNISMTISDDMSFADVTIAAGSEVSIGAALSLESTITLAQGVSLDVTDGGSIAFGEGFELVLDYTLDYDVDYTIFTGVGDITSTLADVTITSSTDFDPTAYEYTWTYNDDNSVSLSLDAIVDAGGIVWDSESGSITGGDADSYAAADILIDTTDVTGATLNAADGATIASLTISGTNALTINGDNKLTVTGTLDISNAVTASAALAADTINLNESASLSVGSTVTADALTSADATASVTVTSGSLTVTDATGYTGSILLSGGSMTLGVTGAEGTLNLSSLSLSSGTTATIYNAITTSSDIIADGVATFNGAVTTSGKLYNRNGNSRTFNSTVDAGGIWITNGTNKYMDAVTVDEQLYINGGTTTFSDTVSAGSIYTANSSTVTFSGEVTVTADDELDGATGAIQLVNATVTFNDAVTAETVSVTSSTGTKTFNSTLDATSLSVTVGTVNLKGATTLDTLSVTGGTVNLSSTATVSGTTTASSTLNITGTEGAASSLTTGTLTGTGAITVGAYGSLSMTTVDNFTGSLTLAGGSLTTDSLSTNITVTADSSLAGVDSALMLNSTITMTSADYSIDLTGAGTVSIGDDFSLVLDYSTTVGDYTIFTNAANDFSSSLITDKYSIQGGFNSDYTYTWAYGNNGNVSLSVAEYNDGGNLDVGGDDAVIDKVVSGEESYDSVNVSGSEDSTLSGEGSITSDTLDKSGTGALNVDITVKTDSITITDGSINVGDDGSLTSGNITVTAATDGTASLTQTGADDATLKDDTLSNADVATAAVTVTGNATLTDSTIDDASTLAVDNGTLSVTGTSSIAADTTIANGASITAGLITVASAVEGTSINYTDGGSLSADTVNSAVVSGATIKVAEYVTAGSSIFSAREATYTGGVLQNTKIKDASSIQLAQSANLKLDTVVIGADTTFTADGTNELTFTNCNTINANTTDNLDIAFVASPAVGASVATYTIDTFDSLTSTSSVILEGELWISLSLTGAEFAAVQGYWSNGELFDIILEFGDAPITDSLTNATVMISNADGAGSYALTVDANAVQVSGNDLVITVPEPSTATLSLLALTALLARRRRRQA